MTDREKLIALIDEGRQKRHGICYFHEDCALCKYDADGDNCGDGVIADRLLANGVVVREKGEWKRVAHDGSWRVDKCSICHRRIHYVDYDQPYPFCPNCGADMRAAKEKA